MSSDRQRTPTREEITVFLEQHGLPEALRGPIESLVVDYAAHRVTMMQPALTSLPTLFGDHAALADIETIAPRDFDTGEVRMPPTSVLHGGSPLIQRSLLGRGGMGDVFQAWEPSLNRVLAMKVLHEKFLDNNRIRAQFLVEASVTAQLTHPGIPPVHALGTHQNRPCFTMKEVLGRTLSSVIEQLHHEGPAEDDQEWSEARCLSVFHKVCDAVAYAHSRGVVHCDLKPENIMVGAFGEVLVMDWGVARLAEPAGGPSVSERVEVPGHPTMEGAIAGTPAYMPPEQAAGDEDLIGPPADVFALGVILYELMTGELPFEASNNLKRILEAMEGNIRPMVLPSNSTVDQALKDIIYKALAPQPEDRYPHAAALADDVRRWREGAQRRERAQAQLDEARARLPHIADLRERASAAKVVASELPDATERWSLEDAAAELEKQASLVQLEVTQKLHAALAHAPELAEAHELLATIYRREHEKAEGERNWSEAARQAVLLRAHDQGAHAAYIAGHGQLSLITQVPAQVELFRYEQEERRLTPLSMGVIGTTPLAEHPIEAGSYLAVLRVPDRPPVRLPIHVPRSQDTPRPPEGSDPCIPIPTPDQIDEDEVFVPPGWFLMGGDDQAPGAGPRRRVWVDGFVIQRTPVCWRELSAFLSSSEGREARTDVLRGGSISLFRPAWPATGLSCAAAAAYARWLSARDGLEWRLPTEIQWEKAARGVDGRWYPWGDILHGSFAHVRTGTKAPTLPRACTHPVDVSPYGVVGMAGNTRDWCADPFDPDGDPNLHVVRGGSFLTQVSAARVASRAGIDGRAGYADVGLRLVRKLGPSN